MISVITITIKRYVDQRSISTINRIKCLVPFGIKKPASNPSEVQLTNDSYAFIMYLPLIDNFSQATKMSKELKKSVKNVSLIENLEV